MIGTAIVIDAAKLIAHHLPNVLTYNLLLMTD